MPGDVRARTAAVTTALNTLLTVLKFILYGMSGSLAVLAEAWHSFSDIGTSLMVFVAVRRSGRSEPGNEGSAAPGIGRFELLIALGIGLLLSVVGISLLVKFFSAGQAEVQKPLVSGLVFLVFSLGSYFICRFETRVGEREGSLGLVADGMHARADMTASLLTGFSLILYSLGLDLDRWVAGLIAVFILSFALETIVNVALSYRHGREDNLFTYRSFKILGFLLERDGLQSAASAVKLFLRQRLGSTAAAAAAYRIVLYLPVLVPALLYANTCFYRVGVREQAVVERFGRPVSRQAVQPGLHLKFPWPVDRVRRVPVRLIQELNIGNVAPAQTRALLWTQRHGSEEAFISGDNNFFYPYIVLHFKVGDVFDYLYSTVEPRLLVSNTAHHIATRMFSATSFYRLAATSRGAIEHDFFERLQGELDRLEAGVEVLSVNFRDIHPPISVADSFERVIAGFQEKQQTINEALKYRKKVLPESRAEAARAVEASRGYISTRTKTARGEARRFVLRLPPTARDKRIERSRRYLKTMQESLRDKANIIIDPAAGQAQIWAGFENMLPKQEKGDIGQ